jgi:hypothetical protein
MTPFLIFLAVVAGVTGASTACGVNMAFTVKSSLDRAPWYKVDTESSETRGVGALTITAIGSVIALIVAASVIGTAPERVDAPVVGAGERSTPTITPTGEATGQLPCAVRSWPSTPIECQSAFRLGSQAGARVDSAQIWLTTLGDARAALNWAKQVEEPPGEEAVWVILYRGRWRCCPNAYDENGQLIPEVEQSQWLVVVDALREDAGFIFIGNWSGEAMPSALPEWHSSPAPLGARPLSSLFHHMDDRLLR